MNGVNLRMVRYGGRFGHADKRLAAVDLLTQAFSFGSTARYTSPIPPAPIGSMILWCDITVPLFGGIWA